MDRIFVTKHYEVLELMCNKLITVCDEEYCGLNQDDIAKELGISRVYVNKIYKELSERGYIEKIHKGRWKVKDSGKSVVEMTNMK